MAPSYPGSVVCRRRHRPKNAWCLSSLKRAPETSERTVKHVCDRYEVGILWREGEVKFPDNGLMAEKRLESTERKLKHDEEVAKKYCDIIEDYVYKGYVRKLTPEEASVSTPKQWFLPRHTVRNPNKPYKVWIVMDASCQTWWSIPEWQTSLWDGSPE